MNSCALEQGKIGLVIEETHEVRLNQGKILISIGEIGLSGATIFKIGSLNFDFIVNQQNPITSMDLASLKMIYDGSINSWNQLGIDAGAIQLWQYPAETDIRRYVSEALQLSFDITIPAGTTPNSLAMREMVSANPNALGYLPSQYVDDSVNPIEFRGVESELFHLPILAAKKGQLTPEESTWLACLSSSIDHD